MKKVNIYTLAMVFILLTSCKVDRIKHGIIYSKKEALDNSERSTIEAKREIYKKLAINISKEIGRDDIEVVAGEIENRDIIKFSDTNIVNIKIKTNGNKYITYIKLNDKSLYTNALNILSSLKQEGMINDKIFRAKASIAIDKNTPLSPFTKSSIERNTLSRAREKLYDTAIENNIDANRANEITNTAYVIEESYSDKEYTIVIEGVLIN